MWRTYSQLTQSATEIRRGMMRETLRKCGEGLSERTNITVPLMTDEWGMDESGLAEWHPAPSDQSRNPTSGKLQMSEYDPTATASALLLDAQKLISNERARDHGNMMDLHQTISRLWSTYISAATKQEVEICPLDVATMMELLKVSRRLHGDHKRDHYLDAAGYAAIAYAVSYQTRDRQE